MVEQLTLNQWVPSSSLGSVTKYGGETHKYPHALTLAEKNFRFPQFADNLFDGVAFSWHLTCLVVLILTCM